MLIWFHAWLWVQLHYFNLGFSGFGGGQRGLRHRIAAVSSPVSERTEIVFKCIIVTLYLAYFCLWHHLTCKTKETLTLKHLLLIIKCKLEICFVVCTHIYPLLCSLNICSSNVQNFTQLLCWSIQLMCLQTSEGELSLGQPWNSLFPHTRSGRLCLNIPSVLSIAAAHNSSCLCTQHGYNRRAPTSETLNCEILVT